MKIGLLSDAHGNSVTLKVCLQHLSAFQVDSVYFLGDAVGYFPGEIDVLETLNAEGIYCQKGNHEAMLLGQIPLAANKDRVYRIGFARQRISRAKQELIEKWPEQRVLEIAGRKILLVHGSPSNRLQGYVYPDSDLSVFDELEYDAIFMGNSHYPFVSDRNGRLIVNVGSCGLPRDQGDLFAFAVYDCETNTCAVYRVQIHPDEIISFFGPDQISPEVLQCLLRESTSVPFGQILPSEKSK